MKTIVIDIGGTNFRIGLFNEEGKIENVKKVGTPNFINNPTLPIAELQTLLMEKIVLSVKNYQNKYKVIDVVGLSFPGPVTNKGIVGKTATIWGDRGANYPIKKQLESRMPGINWIIANDITAAAERYGNMDKYSTCDYLCVITISSGVGNKVYDVGQKRVVLEKMSIGGELGHVQYDLTSNASICECGGRGHIACFSSGRAAEKTVKFIAKHEPRRFEKSILKTLAKKTTIITNESLIEAAKINDELALAIVDKVTFPIAYSMGYLSGTIGIGKFIIIGGFALNLGDIYLNSLKRNLDKVEFFNRTPEEVKGLVDLGINDDYDSLIGIGILAQKEIRTKAKI